ncbi:MAG: permease-like cell division protein FtsX [candidate division WOR-3 bacterium]
MKPILSESIRAYRANSLMAWFSVISSFLLLLLFGISSVITLGVLGLLSEMRKDLCLEVFMKDDATPAQIAHLESVVPQLAGVQSIRHISKENALEEFTQEFPEFSEIQGLLGEIPLPESYRITPKENWRSAELMGMLAKKLSSLPGVEEVYYGGEFLQGAERVYRSVLFVTAALFIVVFVATTFIIFQTLRLTVTSRKDVIEVGLLVGAPIWKMRFPFMLDGCLYGLFGGGFAALALMGFAWVIGNVLGVRIPGLEWVFALLPLSGIFLGFIASSSALSEVMGR